MKRFLLWSFDRGSIQYDIICALILAFVRLTPRSLFHDRPEFMQVPDSQAIRQSSDDDGHQVFTVKVETSAFRAGKVAEQDAVERLKALLHEPFKVSRTEPIYDT